MCMCVLCKPHSRENCIDITFMKNKKSNIEMFLKLPFILVRSSCIAPSIACIHTSVSQCKGHSKWQNIQHIKAEGDALKSMRIRKHMHRIRLAITREQNCFQFHLPHRTNQFYVIPFLQKAVQRIRLITRISNQPLSWPSRSLCRRRPLPQL